MKYSIVITIPSHPRYLSLIRTVTAKAGEIYGMSHDVIEKVKLAIDEACSNILKYAYCGDADKKIIVKFRVARKKFEVIIEDSGIKAQPECIAGRNLDDVRPGGLGIHLIKRAFDVYEFDERKKTGNRLRLIKYIKAKNED